MTIYDQEKELFKFYLNSNLFNEKNKAEYLIQNKEIEEIKKTYTVCTERPHSHYMNIELVVRPHCNQNCTYCYIAQHGQELYPENERVNNETILKNLDSLLDFIYNQQGLFIGDYELFAGDMFYDNLYFDLLDIFYKYLVIEAKKYPRLYDIHSRDQMQIAAPVNMTFVYDDNKVARYDEYYRKFREIGVVLWLSGSTDGAYAVNTREQKTLPDKYFDKIFEFCAKYGYGFHPMVAAVNIKNWVKNYDWWKAKYAEYQFDIIDGPKCFLPMMLEVRNNDWDEESIDDLLKFIDYIYEDRFDMNERDPYKMARHLWLGDGSDHSKHQLDAYDPLLLHVEDPNAQGILCTLQTTLHIALNNLGIIAGHRLAYKQFTAGWFIQNENNKIIDIEPHNVNLFMTLMDIRRRNMPKCNNCIYQPFCIGGCSGAQYENTGELFHPNFSTCCMLRAKYAFLVYKYEQNGVLDAAIKNNFVPDRALTVMEEIRQTPEYQRWQNGLGR